MREERDRTLWSITRGQRLRFAAAMFAMGLGFALAFGVPQVARIAIDDVVGQSGVQPPFWLAGPADAFGINALWIAAVAIFVLTAAGGVFQYLRGRWAAIASEAIVRRLRDLLYRHLGRLPCSYHDRAETGDLVQRCSSDVETLRVFLSGQVVEIGRPVLMVLVVIPIMLAMDTRMTLVSIASFPLLFVAAFWFFRKVRKLFLVTDEAEGKLTSVIQENLTGIRVVRAFARQDFECEKFGARNADYRDRHYALVRAIGSYYALSDLVCMSQIGLVLILGCGWMTAGEITVGALFAFVTYVSMIIWPVRHLGRVLADIGKALVALGRLREVLAVEPEADLDAAREQGPERVRGEIEFRGLTFAFGEGEPALEDITLRVRAGETVALLGPPGSGKSTLIQLLLRLYDYEEGEILLDGAEIRALPRRFVRSRIGVVLQEPFLYSKTISANVRVGRSSADESAMEEAAAAAAIHGSIEGFDEGYDTLVGERGVTLSGGQRQRLALARALVKDPDILILDDALSAVDTKTEAQILDALRGRDGRCTTILIAHRISSILQADRIFVLEHGRIEQQGTHRELSKEDGPYRRLWSIQGALEEELTDDLRQAGRK